jgi:hypothetical protein
MVINRDKIKLKGKGHELSDFSKLIQTYKNWHMQFAPKLKFEFATSKINGYSGKKDVLEHVGKLRQVYKGELDLFFDPQPNKATDDAKASDLFASKPSNQFNIEKAQAQQAEKEKE